MTLRVRDFKRIVFFTGAGMSAESGVPTYRGKGGVWKEFDYENCACQGAFDRDPDYVWEFHNYRRELVSACEPNLGHRLIAGCERQLANVTVVTQNIDGLHQAAGSERVLELHGSLWKLRCDACGWSDEDHSVPVALLECPACAKAYKRPDIVWFGDSLRADVITATEQALRECDLLVAIGTSAVVHPAAEIPFIAKQAGATMIEINPEITPMSLNYRHRIREPATEALAWLCEGIEATAQAKQ